MSILICVIIALVAINVVLAYYVINMHFFMKNRVNSIIRNSETLINISKDLKECAGKVNSEPQNINSSSSIDDKISSILSYVRDINACVVFFTATMTVDLFLSAYLKNMWSQYFIFFWGLGIIALIPFIALGIKLACCRTTNIIGTVFISFMIVIVYTLSGFFIIYSLVTIPPIVINLLKSIGFFQ